MTKLKSLYAKAAPWISKVSLGFLVLSVVGVVISMMLKKIYTEPWPIFYASLAELIFTWIAVIAGALFVLLNLRKVWAWLKERIRKAIVSLKRNPSMIPLLTLVAAFLVYSLNLTDVSDTTARIQGAGMGLCQFSMMLFTILSMVCMLNAFPRRKKANIPMLVIMFAMFGIVIYSDIHYRNAVLNALSRPESPIELTEYIANAFNMLNIYMVLILVAAALVVLLPVYGKLLKKINTSVELEDNGSMDQIEINE